MALTSPVAIPRDKPKKPEHQHHATTTTSHATDEARWRIVLAHKPTPSFLYAVLSTGIYCRTSCPSRRPRRANVRFFNSAADARAAGFRACRRCKPESGDASHESPRAAAEKQVAISCEFVRRRGGAVQLVDIAGHVGLSPRYLHGLFKEVMGVTPGTYAAGVRERQQHPVSEVPFEAALDNVPPHAMTFGDTNDLLDTAPMDDGGTGGGMPMLNWDPTGGNWLTEALEGFDGSEFDFGQCNTYPEWFTECTLDIMKVSRMSSETIESPMSFDLTGCVDPSLLSSLGVPP